MIPVVSRQNPLSHYVWGDNCDGWNLVDKAELSVKMERMPPHTAEQEHFHQRARQFFFILKGTATFVFVEGVGPVVDAKTVENAETVEGVETRIEVKAQQGLEVPAGLRHRILNESEQDLEFILCSQPSTAGDRINI
jgi:mannose-6-phosphate isomerase-like protein (cupin superfamily)